MFSCLQILEAFLWFVLITLLNVTLIILTLSVSRLLNLLLRLVAFLLFLNPQCLASISRWITASSSWIILHLGNLFLIVQLHFSKLFLILKSGVNHTSRGSISTSTLPSIKLRKCSSKIITSILSFISGRLATKSNQIKQLIRNGRSASL